jgi:hypothetical protein
MQHDGQGEHDERTHEDGNSNVRHRTQVEEQPARQHRHRPQSEVSLPQKRRSIHGDDVLPSLLGEQVSVVSVVSVVSDALCQIAAAIEARQVFQLLLDLGGELGALLNLVKTPLQDFGGETELFADGVQYRWVGFDHAPDGVVNGLCWLWLWLLLLLLLPGRIIFRVDSRILRLHLS